MRGGRNKALGEAKSPPKFRVMVCVYEGRNVASQEDAQLKGVFAVLDNDLDVALEIVACGFSRGLQRRHLSVWPTYQA